MWDKNIALVELYIVMRLFDLYSKIEVICANGNMEYGEYGTMERETEIESGVFYTLSTSPLLSTCYIE